MAITGNTLNLDVQGSEILQVLPDLIIVFIITEAIELGTLHITIPINHKTDIVGKISPIKDNMNLFFLGNRKYWWTLKEVFEDPLNGAPAITTSVCNLVYRLLPQDPMGKPNEKLIVSLAFIPPCK